MSYTSNLKGRLIIDDSNYTQFINETDGDGELLCRGYNPRDYGAAPFGSFADPLPQEFYIDSAEWAERIEMLDKVEGQPFHHKKRAGFKSLDQGKTNYCWINAPVQCCHYVRAMQGLEHIPLSPASVGAKIKRFRNVGGWGSEGMQYLVEHGVVPQSMWPANAIDSQYDTSAADTERAKYKVHEFYELPERSFHALVSCILRGWPVAIGLNWWRHEITACGLHIQGSDPESDVVVEIDNSWSESWGDNGHGILTRSKATPDDAVVARVLIPS
jgi:hypothetical protein